MSRRYAVALCAALSVGASLSACSGGDPGGTATTSSPAATSSPTTSSPTTPSPSTTTTSKPTPSATSTIPPEAKEHTKAGAEAFVRFYFDEVNKAWMEPSVRNLAAYGASTCKSCASNLREAERLERGGLRYDGPPASFQAFTTRQQDDRFYVTVDATQEARNIVRKDGTVEERVAAMHVIVEAEVSRVSGGWLIQAIRS